MNKKREVHRKDRRKTKENEEGRISGSYGSPGLHDGSFSGTAYYDLDKLCSKPIGHHVPLYTSTHTHTLTEI